MNRIIKSWKVWASVGLVLAAGVAFAFVVDGARAEQPWDWPTLTMTYPVTLTVNEEAIQQTRELMYNSWDSWTETVTAADSFEIPQGTFSDVGSYQMVANGKYITYDATTGETLTEDIKDGVVHIARGGLSPMPLSKLEEHLGKKLTSVTTATRVCFNDECTDNATGWEMRDGKSVVVFADDARGIPVKIGDFTVSEVRVDATKESLR